MDKEFTGLIDAWVEGVYRFHLARCGDWLDAETLTAQTFLDAYLSGTRGPAGLLRLAIARQARHRSGVHLGEGYPEDRAAEDGETEQDRLLQRARITALQDYWSKLEPAQADAVALACFAGLDLATIARTHFAPLSQVNTWLDSQAEVAVQLAELGAVTPVPDGYKSELIAALSQVSPPDWGQRQLEQTSQRLKWLAYQVRPGLSHFRRFAFVGLVVLLVGFGVLSTLNKAKKPPATLTTLVKPQPATQTPQQDLEAVGFLLPPDLKVCQDWQRRLSWLTGGEATLNPTSTFNDPSGTGADFYGKGCFITLNTALAAGANTLAIQKQLVDWLTKDGFKRSKEFPADLNLGDSGSSQPTHYHGQGYSLVRGNDHVVFEWLGNELSPAYPAASGADLQLIYFGFATRAAQPVVQGFTAAWANGSDSANQFLTTELRLRLPDLAALDQLAGIVRSGASSVTINWKPVENQGDSLRLTLSLAQMSLLALPSPQLGSLQMVLHRENGQWKISDLSTGIIFNQSGDALVLVDARGQIYSLSLDDGRRINLSEPGLYPLHIQYSGLLLADIHPPPRISPDGRWLFIAPPGDGPAWLLSLDGKTHLPLDPRMVCFTWAPDSTRFAYFTRDRNNQLMVQRIGESPSPAAWTPGHVLAAAWSPLGDWIGLAYEDSGRLSIARASPAIRGPFDIVWSTPWTMGTPVPAVALGWTADQNELWFTPARVSIHFQDRTVYWLVNRPGDQATEDLLATSLGNPTSTSGPAALSPDEKWFAQVVDNPPHEALLAYFWVRVQPAGESNGIPRFIFSPKVDQLAWVSDSQSLILIGNRLDPPSGLLFARLNPTTQEQAPVSEDAPAQVFLGLKSNLQAASQPKPLRAELVRFPLPKTDQEWHAFQDSATHLSMMIPNQWHVWQSPVRGILSQANSPATLAELTLTNFDFTSPLGFASLRRGDVTIQITTSAFEAMQSPDDWLAAQTRQTALVTAFPITGQQSYWVIRPDNTEFFKTVIFTTPDAGYTLEWYSFTSATDAVVDRILASIQLTH